RQPPVYQSTALVLVGSPTNVDGLDDSALVVGRPNVAFAVEQSQLDLLVPSRAGDSAKSIAAEISKSLRARQVEATSRGRVYEVSYSSPSPELAKQVVEAIIEAGHTTIASAPENATWEESNRLLSEAHEGVSSRIDALYEELRQIELRQRSIPIDGQVQSVASVRWKLLQESLDAERSLHSSLQQRLRMVEEQLARGTSEKELLRSLSQPIRVQTAGGDPVEDAKAQKALAPLEAELERALQRYARLHPTVVAIQKRIDAMRSQYGLDEASALTITEVASKDWSTSREGVDYLREQVTNSQQRTDELLAELDSVAIQMTNEDRLSRQSEQLRDRLAQERLLQDQILMRLEELPASSPFPTNSYAILRSPEEGRVVSPRAGAILAIACATGAIAGLGLGALYSLGSLMSVRDEREESASSQQLSTIEIATLGGEVGCEA
ncbi:MAG: hypothetical protein AAFX06_12195, partial [Planctomycetota bacterium]